VQPLQYAVVTSIVLSYKVYRPGGGAQAVRAGIGNDDLVRLGRISGRRRVRRKSERRSIASSWSFPRSAAEPPS
jgi:hypothetical protein